MKTKSMTFDVTYGFKYSANTSLTIVYNDTGEYDEYQVISDYGELMFKHFDFKKIIKFINDLLDGVYAR